MRVLILSAPVGAGHNAAAAAVSEELDQRGHEATVVDGLALLGVEGLVVGSYRFQILHAGWSWRLLYRGTRLRWVIRVAGAFLSRRSGPLQQLIAESQPDMIVSAYPLVSAALAGLRRRGLLPHPTATLVTDFDPHPCWIHPDLDANLVVGEPHAGTVAIKPPVSRPPARPVGRDALWADLGLAPGRRTALIVGGAWGVGNLLGAAEAVLAAAGTQVIVVAGHNEELRRRLERTLDPARAAVLGFTDRMAELMGISDVLIQNAGGLTCLEAFAGGLPVVMFEPLPGHGEDNSRHMERAGVVVAVRRPVELTQLVESPGYWDARAPETAAAARARFARAAAAEALEHLSASPGPARPQRRMRPVIVATILFACWFAAEHPTSVSNISDIAAKPPPAASAPRAS